MSKEGPPEDIRRIFEQPGVDAGQIIIDGVARATAESATIIELPGGTEDRFSQEVVSRIYHEADGEGWDFDGMSYDEFLALPKDIQERAIAGYRDKMGIVLKSEVQVSPVPEAADPYFRGDWHGHDTATQGSIDL